MYEEIYLSLIKARKENKFVIWLWPNIPLVKINYIKNNVAIKLKTSHGRTFTIINFFYSFHFYFLSCIYIIIKHFNFLKNSSNILKKYLLCPRIGINDLYLIDLNSNLSCIHNFKNITNCDLKKELVKKLNLSKLYPKSKDLFNHLGLKKKYVCLHIRSSNTYGDDKSDRNASINNYYPAIYFLLSQGYAIVRMGDKSMPLFNINNPNFINYAHSSYRNIQNDINLVANCEFYFGMTSGIWGLAWMLEKRMLIVNNTSFHYFAQKADDCNVFKNYFSKRKNKYLSYQEIFGEYYHLSHFLEYPNHDEDITVIENTPEQLLNILKNFLKNSKTKTKINLYKIRKTSALKYINDSRFNQIPTFQKCRYLIMTLISNGFLDYDDFKLRENGKL